MTRSSNWWLQKQRARKREEASSSSPSLSRLFCDLKRYRNIRYPHLGVVRGTDMGVLKGGDLRKAYSSIGKGEWKRGALRSRSDVGSRWLLPLSGSTRSDFLSSPGHIAAPGLPAAEVFSVVAEPSSEGRESAAERNLQNAVTDGRRTTNGAVDRRVRVDEITFDAMRTEYLGLGGRTTEYLLALALLDSESVFCQHEYSDETVEDEEDGTSELIGDRDDARVGPERKAARLRQALRSIQNDVGSYHRTVDDWDSASKLLSRVMILPSENDGKEEDDCVYDGYFSNLTRCGSNSRASVASKRRPARRHDLLDFQKYRDLIQMKLRERMTRTSAAQLKWKQIASWKVPGASTAAAADGFASDRIDERIAEAERAARARFQLADLDINKAIAEREKKEEEARSIASSLLRPLTPEEVEIVRKAMYGLGPEDEILANSETDSVQRHSMWTLQPRAWLNDEVIHFFLLMLARRDEAMCREDSSRKRSHFFKSFFVTKLLDEGGYKYNNVKRWSKKVPGKDVFNLSKIFFPVNVGGVHWTVVVAFMEKKIIQYYDSMGSNGREFLEGIFKYLKDEHKTKKGCPLPGEDEWQLVECSPDTPQQTNGFDCGVFACMFADFLSKDYPLSFTQEHVDQCRERIALSIINGSAIN